MAGKIEGYREALRNLTDWEPYLLRESGLPGPRGNLELAAAVSLEGDEPLFRRLLLHPPEQAPVNSPAEFLVFCGVAGLGRVAATGRPEILDELRPFASDPRWRVREAAAFALQYFGDADMPGLLAVAARWAAGSLLERRAVVAGLCEPRLLTHSGHAAAVLDILDRITSSLLDQADRRAEPFRVLRQALAYGWSVAAVALPEKGLPLLEKWARSTNPDVRWIVKSNLGKARLQRIAPEWVTRVAAEL